MPNTALFARALFRLHADGLLKLPALKDPVLMFIRRSTETKHHHLTAHYRSRAAAEMLACEEFRSAHACHKYCNNRLRHEHVVPGKVIYDMIIAQEDITEEWLHSTLQQFGLRATITLEENARLEAASLAKRMPDGFWDPASPLYRNPFARYIEIGLDAELIARPGEAWPVGEPGCAAATKATRPSATQGEFQSDVGTTAFSDDVTAVLERIQLPAGFHWSFRDDGLKTLHYGTSNVVLELDPKPSLSAVDVSARPIAKRTRGEPYPALTPVGRMGPDGLSQYINAMLAPHRTE